MSEQYFQIRLQNQFGCTLGRLNWESGTLEYIGRRENVDAAARTMVRYIVENRKNHPVDLLSFQNARRQLIAQVYWHNNVAHVEGSVHPSAEQFFQIVSEHRKNHDNPMLQRTCVGHIRDALDRMAAHQKPTLSPETMTRLKLASEIKEFNAKLDAA